MPSFSFFLCMFATRDCQVCFCWRISCHSVCRGTLPSSECPPRASWGWSLWSWCRWGTPRPLPWAAVTRIWRSLEECSYSMSKIFIWWRCITKTVILFIWPIIRHISNYSANCWRLWCKLRCDRILFAELKTLSHSVQGVGFGKCLSSMW